MSQTSTFPSIKSYEKKFIQSSYKTTSKHMDLLMGTFLLLKIPTLRVYVLH